MSHINYQELRAEYENAKVVDYRDPENPNNHVLITCEHAKNVLPDEYSWTEHDKRYFVNEHWGYDIGAFDMAEALAKELKCVFVHSLYSRLLLDPNRTIVADTLFRKNGDGEEVDLNKDLTHEEEQIRIKKYFLSYYEAIREISTKVNPTYILSIHSFTPMYEGQSRTVEVGVLYGQESSRFALDLNEGMKTKGYKSEANKPYDGLKTQGVLNALIYAKYPARREGVTFEFRNDILSNKEGFAKMKEATVDVVKNICRVD
jgi:predicted N-formylglutamate amidohydrolase